MMIQGPRLFFSGTDKASIHRIKPLSLREHAQRLYDELLGGYQADVTGTVDGQFAFARKLPNPRALHDRTQPDFIFFPIEGEEPLEGFVEDDRQALFTDDEPADADWGREEDGQPTTPRSSFDWLF